MKVFAVSVLVWVAALSGCASPQSTLDGERQTYLATAPNIAPDVKAAILAGQIKVGMDASQIRASWGAPNKTQRSDGPYGPQDIWIYGYSDYYYNFVPTTYIYMENAVVTSWQSFDP